ncbi:Phosphatidate cytidylyltransferase [hydrothermal vent metagenome]|uniref:Phosphatidate cytidylyltransferase n=1 Tax=hydrothermal vent metagenome TaxID=652676 RepID=A0A3B1C188_9ZZZZ
MNNRTTRILVAVLSIPVLLGLSYWGKIPFLLFILLIGTFSFYEFSVMVKNKDANVNKLLGILAVALLIADAYFQMIDFQLLVLSEVIIIFLIELFRDKGSAMQNIGSTLVGLFYIGLFSSTIILIREIYSGSLHYNDGGLLIISIFITLWVTDSAAYFLGSAFGKHKLFPRVSPSKSWEGAIAGFVFAIITMIVLQTFLLTFLNLTDALVLGIIVGLFGQIGDLIESLIKRDTGVKDSSNIIPGHGGIFDRFDSLIFSSPFVFIYITYLM